MGRLNKLLSFVRRGKVSDVKVDPGGGAIRTAEHFSAPGDDSFPLPGDIVVTVPVSGRLAAVGYFDPVNTPLTVAGEKRIYSRDSSGVVMADVLLKADGGVEATAAAGVVTVEVLPDGTITQTTGISSLTMTALGVVTLTNGIGSIVMAADGSILINGVGFSTAGVIVGGGGINLDTHTHPQGVDSAGDTQQNTGAPL